MRLAFLVFLLVSSLSGFGHASIDQAAYNRLVERAQETRSDALIVYFNGKLHSENYFGKKPKQIEAMSSTKSIVSLAIGKLLTDGKISSIDQPVSDFYAEWKQDPEKSRITIRHLLNHTSGIAVTNNDDIYAARDMVKLALDATVTDPPGTRFLYNNKAVNLLPGIVHKASGERLDKFLAARVFKPLGIKNFRWALDNAGNPQGFAGFQVFPADLAKLGQLAANRGTWNGRRIIDEKWFDESVTTTKLDESCGLLWWIRHDEQFSVIDDAHINKLRNVGFDEPMLDKIASIKGRHRRDEFVALLNGRVLNKVGNWTQHYVPLLTKSGLRVARTEFGNPVGYSSDGFLGNNMAIYPEKNLVVVRMISWESFHVGARTQDGSGPNNFSDFYSLSYRIVR